MIRKASLILILVLCGLLANAQQVQIKGTVFERTQSMGLPGVSVHSTGGSGAITDSLGRYTIKAGINDSLSFSYQGKATQLFPVKNISLVRPFDMKLYVDVKTLATVEVFAKSRTYKSDSIDRRREYGKYFDFAPEYLTTNPSGATFGGAGVNLDALFSLGKIKRMQNFRKLLLRDEQEKFVDYRFNKTLVQRITGLEGDMLDGYMVEYRPTYEMLLSFENEYDYLRFIKETSEDYANWWRKNHFKQPKQ
ncbi:hypothetical protein [Chitinophaga sp. sic0106]|uniref:hypothetical protein n=1 Tax=Chitinophaga sp. sic0106 TaxID=2854785 RepID=UPI001C44DCE0|nr:hypothetical protein [Chitinophaga sp. sic0106]MBV7530137.1 hypothetical protein [Chitinophaga sp. sic0106]